MCARYAVEFTTHPPPPLHRALWLLCGADAPVMTLDCMHFPFSFFFVSDLAPQSSMWGAVVSHVCALWLSL